MPHHTKDKGDLGVVKAQVDLVQRGYLVLVPFSEHAPFDLVAYKQHEFLRIQVKYRSAIKGVLRISFRTSWADKNGSHERAIDKDEVDLFCVYCPETDECYYFKPQEFGQGTSLRVVAPKNNQAKLVRMAEEFRKIP
jgi:hypothetical protein